MGAPWTNCSATLDAVFSAAYWPWSHLRKELPVLYEPYSDPVPGEWMYLTIVIRHTGARCTPAGEAAVLEWSTFGARRFEKAKSLWIVRGH